MKAKPILIHGKPYYTVANRITEMHESLKDAGVRITIETEVLRWEPVTVKATVTIGENVYTGMSYANETKAIEKTSPIEVAETSAVGRALGFAGFGSVDSIATADEMVKASYAEKAFNVPAPAEKLNDLAPVCKTCKSLDLVVKTVVKEGDNKGRQYWHCMEHGAFSHFKD